MKKKNNWTEEKKDLNDKKIGNMITQKICEDRDGVLGNHETTSSVFQGE